MGKFTLNSLVLFILFIAFPVRATSFIRVSVEEQLQAADSIFIGHFLDQKSIIVEDGTVATQMTFRLSKEYGFNSQRFGMEEIFIHYPGGSWEGERVVIDGVPNFSPGERVAILGRNIDNRFWGLNLAMGSYRIVNYGNETLLINNVFPNDPGNSQINLADFERKVKEIKGSSLRVVKSLELMEQNGPSEGKKRSIASIDGLEENELEETSRPGTFWLLVFLALTGAIASYRVKGKR